jgi:hypothetical protein
VSPELADTALEVLRLAGLYSVALFLPVFLQLLLLYVAGWLLRELVSGVSSIIGALLEAIGVPLHELLHAAAALLTLCGVSAIKLINDETGPGFVEPRRMNVFGRIGASLAPLIGGMLVLWLTATFIIPGFEMPTIEPPRLDLESAASLGTVLRMSVDYLGRFVQAAFENLPELQWDNWRTYVGLYIALSVGIGIAPSGQDFKVMLGALPVATFLAVGLFALLFFSGDIEAQFQSFQQGLWPYIFKFSTAVTYAFVLTAVGIVVFLPLRLIAKVRER